MKAKVTKAFYDLEHPENTYQPGDVFEGSEQRVKGLVAGGFVLACEESKPARGKAAARKSKTAR